MINGRTRAALLAGVALFTGFVSQGATLAHWDFNDPSLGAAQGAPLPDSDQQNVWREAAVDKSGNGNHLTTWDYDWAGFVWSTNSPDGDFSIRAAGGYPAAYTWSAQSSPSGTDLETITPTSFTVEAVFTVGSGSHRAVVGRDARNVRTGDGALSAFYLKIDPNDHPEVIITDQDGDGVDLVASDVTVTADSATWYHMAAVKDATSVSLYLDGNLVATTNISLTGLAIGTTSAPGNYHAGGWSVARSLWNGDHTDRWFGDIDAVAISDVALNSNSFVLDVPDYTNAVPPVPSLADVTSDPVYLFCYHEGYYPAGGNSGVFVSWSTDGYNFYRLNNGHPVFVPPEFSGDDGDNTDGYQNLTRDPSMIYDPVAQLYRLVFTSDINSRSFGYAESPDLVHWQNVKLVQIWDIWDSKPGNVLTSVDHTWAPEWFYNEDTGNYMIIFSSGVNGASLRMWYTETSDFNTFSVPVELFNNGGITVIDGCVRKVSAGHYILAYKNEAAGNQTWIRDGTTPYGPWTNGRPASGGGDEGPCLIKIGSTWHLYYDNFGYGDNVFGLATSTDTTNWVDVTGSTVMPKKTDVPDYGYDGGPPHHGTVFEAPLSTLGAFVAPYQDNVTNLSSLVYRWSFDEPAGSVSSGTVVTDSISGAEAIVNGNRANFTGTGLRLPGDTTGTGDAAYFDMPNGMISALSNLTVEIWATPIASKNWQRLFSFGRTAEAGDGGGEWTGPASGGTSAQKAMYWTINAGTSISRQNCVMLDAADIYKDAVSGTTMETVTGTRYYYVFTFEDGVGFFGATGGRMAFYRNGYQIGWRDVPFRLQDIDDVNNWLGRSQWSGDSNSNVEYDEVRIYSQALSWYDIYGHYLAGPDVPVDEYPTLQITSAAGTVMVNWPGNAAGFSLRETESISPPAPWSDVTNAVDSTTNGLQVTLPMGFGNRHFRLEK